MKPAVISLLLFAASGPLYPGEGTVPSPTEPAAVLTPAPPTQKVSGGFTRYIPNEAGDYEWKLEGESVTFLSPDSLEVTLLTATALDPQLEGLTIKAGKMIYFTDSGIARNAEARVTVRRENTVLTGRGYLWTPQNRQIRIYEDVRFLIREEGQEGLFPL